MLAWLETTLGEVCIGIFDGPHATPKKTQSGPLFLGISSLANGRLLLSDTEHLSEADFTKWTRRVAPQPDDVVFSYETRLGEAALIPEGLRCCLGRRLALMRPDKTKIEPRFLLYYYLSPTFQDFLRSRTNPGSTVDRILLTEVPSYPILLPPLEEQHAIAGTLGALDDKIELNRQMNRTLEAMARAIFTSWFVDFDPVTAKAAGGQPVGLDAGTITLFPDRFVDSDLGHIPAGWRVGPFSDMVNIHGGGTPKTDVPEYWGGDIPWFSVVDTPGPGDVFVLWTKKTISQKGLDESAAQLLEPGTAIITARGTVGNVVVVGVPMAMNQSCYALSGKPGYGAYYVYYSSLELVDELRQMAHGSVFDTIIRSTFDGIKVVIPPPQLASRFHSQVAPLLERIRSNLKESDRLTAVRDALLPKLLSGEIRVRDGKKVAEQALA